MFYFNPIKLDPTITSEPAKPLILNTQLLQLVT